MNIYKNLSVCLFIFFILATFISFSQTSVLTQHNDLNRTGWNNKETILNTKNVNKNSFGAIFSRTVDDQIYAQPLVVFNINMPVVGNKNIVIIATVNNTVYAFDADSANISNPYWQKNLTPAGERPVRQVDLTGACPGNFLSNIGIVGTPVIDTSSSTIYLVARSINPSTVHFSEYLHALDIRTGQERANSPVLIQAQVNGTGDGNIGGIVHFDPQKNNQRPALLLLKGVVYVGFSSHCDWGPYHGWLLGYNATTLQQQFVYNDTPDGYNGGIWMSGTGPAADSSGNIYFSVGNGSVGKNNNPSDLTNRSESVVRLYPDGSLPPVKDFFTPNNYPSLEAADLDLGTSGVMIIPNAHRTVTGCKDGNLYLLDQGNLGGYNATVNQSVQTIYLGNNANMHAQFSYFGGSANEFAYFWPENTALKAIPFNRATGKFDVQNIITSGIQEPYGQTGAMLSVSSNGNIDSTGILWSSAPVNCDGENYNCPGILRAIDASDVTKELWNSGMFSADNPGNFAKFSSPTIANGKVYLATFSNKLIVYGTLSSNQINGSNQICAGAGTAFTVHKAGTTYQWQSDTGSGFANITDNSNYTGTHTSNLQLNNVPSSWYGYRYRCIVDNVNSNTVTLTFTSIWTGTVNTSWENPGNWSCGKVPDANTDVNINTGQIIVNSNPTIRSLNLNSGVIFKVNPGFKLTINH